MEAGKEVKEEEVDHQPSALDDFGENNEESEDKFFK